MLGGRAGEAVMLVLKAVLWALWGIGARSAAVARQALAEVEARSKSK